MGRQSRNLTHCQDVYRVRDLIDKLFFSLKVIDHQIRERERERNKGFVRFLSKITLKFIKINTKGGN